MRWLKPKPEVDCERCAHVTGYWCMGPCFDYCMCSHCWRGWALPWYMKLWWRLQYILKHGYSG